MTKHVNFGKLSKLSDKHHGKVNSNVCLKSKYHPEMGNFNFAVLDKKILSRSMIDNSKEIVVCLDGKQTAKGLRNSYEGDVNLWGFEGPPSLKDTQISSHKIKNLREAVVRHEILRNSFKNKIQKTPNIGSKYMYAFSEIDAFIERSKSLISEMV